MKRLSHLDVLKGFLILVVMWSHAVQVSADSYLGTYTFKVTYVIQMALFFYISGYVLAIGRHTLQSLPSKMLRLLVPYAAWYFVRCLSQWDWENAGIWLFSTKGFGLWFLRTLCQSIVVLILSDAFCPKRFRMLWMIGVGVIVSVLAGICRNDIVDVHHFAEYYQFVLGGFLVASVKERDNAVPYDLSNLVFGIVFVAFVGCMCFLAFGNASGKMMHMFRMVASWLGCIALPFAFEKLPCDSDGFKWLCAIGRKTLGIYAAHCVMRQIFGVRMHDLHWGAPLVFVIFLVVSLALIYVIERIPALDYLMLGVSKKRIKEKGR